MTEYTQSDPSLANMQEYLFQIAWRVLAQGRSTDEIHGRYHKGLKIFECAVCHALWWDRELTSEDIDYYDPDSDYKYKTWCETCRHQAFDRQWAEEEAERLLLEQQDQYYAKQAVVCAICGEIAFPEDAPVNWWQISVGDNGRFTFICNVCAPPLPPISRQNYGS